MIGIAVVLLAISGDDLETTWVPINGFHVHNWLERMNGLKNGKLRTVIDLGLYVKMPGILKCHFSVPFLMWFFMKEASYGLR
jgi:hypothetical protein